MSVITFVEAAGALAGDLAGLGTGATVPLETAAFSTRPAPNE